MLTQAFPGSSIAAFSCPEDALAHVLKSGTDLLVTDHAMGTMDGAELIRELRAREVAFPMLMLSGNPHAREEAMRAGATGFFQKASSLKELENHIRSLLHG
jgi:DNA-binding NarL/FixJ family response regulator